MLDIAFIALLIAVLFGSWLAVLRLTDMPDGAESTKKPGAHGSTSSP